MCDHVRSHVGVGDTPLPIKALGELLQALTMASFLEILIVPGKEKISLWPISSNMLQKLRLYHLMHPYNLRHERKAGIMLSLFSSWRI